MKKSGPKTTFKMLSVFLAIIVFMMSLPLSALAMGFDTEKDRSPDQSGKSSSDDVIEIVERREESVKHFKLSDGSYVAAQYPVPVHVKDESGNWQDIDNTMKLSGSEYATSDARVKFAKNSNQAKTVTVKQDSYKFSFGLIDANKTKAIVESSADSGTNKASVTKLEQLSVLHKLVSKVRYENAYANTDIEYILTSNRVKENIIVKAKRSEGYTYSFEITANNLNVILNSDGSISLNDQTSGELVFSIPAPFMYDADGNYSDSVSYSLSRKNKKYIVTVTADEAWINADNRAFPVTIDPSLDYGTVEGIVDNTYISSEYPTRNYSNMNYIGISKESNASLIAFSKLLTIPTLPVNAILTEATINFTRRSTTGAASFAVAASQITSNWSASQVTYATKPSYSTVILDYCLIDAASTAYSWDITALMKQWMDGSVTNNGLAFWVTSDSVGDGQITFFDTATGVEEQQRPYYQIKYRDTKGLEDYYDYFTSSADGAGVGNINAFTGNLVFSHDSISTTDELLPYTFGLTYNNVWANQKFSSQNALTIPGFSSVTGYGFKLSFDETLIFKNLNDGGKDKTFYIWSDADGTEHYFRWYNYQVPGTSTIADYYCDEDGLQLHIEFETDSEGKISGYKVCDDKDNYKHFNGKGYLDYIQDANGNKRIFTRDSNNNRVTQISLQPNNWQVINQLTFAYENGKLTSVTNTQTGLTANFYYASVYNGTSYSSAGNYLRKITYVYSSDSTYSVTFEYDAKGQLTVAKDLKTKLAVQYSYDNAGTSILGRVTQVQQYANISEALGVSGAISGQAAGITYGLKQTTYRSSGEDDLYGNSDDIYTVYNFDDTGKAASVYTTDHAFIYGASNYTYADSDEDNQSSVADRVKAAKTKNSLASVMTIGGASANYLRNPGFEKDVTDSNIIPSWDKYGNAYISQSNMYDNDNSYVRMSIPHPQDVTSAYNYAELKQFFYAEEGTYTFSVSINRWSMRSDAKVQLLVYDEAGDIVAESAPAYAYDTSYSMSTLWERISVTFDTNEYCISNGWYVGIRLSYTGTNTTSYSSVYVDSAMLEKGRGVSSYSLLDNGCFEKIDSGWITQNSSIVYQASNAFDSDGVLKVTGQPTKAANAKNTTKFLAPEAYDYDHNEVFADGPMNFVVSGWARATSVKTEYPDNYKDNTAKTPNFALKVVFHYLNTDVTSTHYIPFNDRVTEWQFASGAVSTQPDSNGNYRYVTSMDVYCCYDYNSGTAYFDNISVSKCNDIVSHYYYNEMGYLTTAGSEGGNGVSYEYSDNQTDISNIITTDNNYETQYDEKHRIKLTYDKNYPNNYKTEYTYDSYGNVTSTKMTSLGSSPRIISNSSTYSTNSNYFGALLTETDATGAVNRYFYDGKARLVGVCDAKGNGLIYHYNNFGQLDYAQVATYNSANNSMVAGNQIDIYNGYDEKGQLTSIETDSATYSYLYDSFGNNTEIKVNGQSLVQYIYAANNGKLLQKNYGNNHSVSYLYDGVDRIIGICYNGSQSATFTYSYNAGGQVSEHKDLKNDLVYTYNYDGSGKLIQTTAKSISSNKVSYTVKNTYDDQGRLSSVFNYYTDTKAAPLSYTEYSYDEAGNLTVINFGGTSVSLYYTFDEFGRLSRKQYANTNGGSVNISQSFQYETHNGNCTSGQVKSVVLTDPSGSITTEYQYDTAGNITSIVSKQSGTVISERSYQYDIKGQLVRENVKSNPTSTSKYYNYTMTYTYDNSGNILSKRKYSYTTGSLDGAQYTQTSYAYQSDTPTNDKWNDLLTSYNGQSITYDEIGNPLKYGNYTNFQWNGRQLTQYHYLEEYQDEYESYVYEDLLQFEYDAEGRRVLKNNQYQKIEYVWDGDKIVRQKVFELYGQYMSRDIRFYYDAQGNPSAFRVFNMNQDGTVKDSLSYLLMTNTQGDVIAIYNQSGEKIYTYEYDAWGNMIKGTNVASGGYTADAYNPFRYRGYYWDWEIGLYYTNSRYYNPQWGRFISADVPELSATEPDSVLRYNLYAYCLNNPVNFTDKDGTWPKWATKVLIGVAAVVAGAAIVAATAATGGAAAAFVGAAVTGLKAAAISGAIGAAVGAGTSVFNHYSSTGSCDGVGEAVVTGAIDGFANGFMTGGIMAGGSQAISSVFKIAANAGVPTGRTGGIKIGNKARILSPNHPQGLEPGGTLLKVGSKYKNVRFDVGTKSLFHMNIQFSKTANFHIPIGILGSGLWGGMNRD